jgi:hypothetical protein
LSDNKSATPNPAGDYAERRRTQRVQIAMPVLIRGKNGAQQAFEEDARTISINANGCMIMMGNSLSRGQELSIVNPKTAEELPCRVVFLGKKFDGKTETGLEFVEASPLFWRIAFPPEDWDPAERKKPTHQAPRPIAAPPLKRT